MICVTRASLHLRSFTEMSVCLHEAISKNVAATERLANASSTPKREHGTRTRISGQHRPSVPRLSGDVGAIQILGTMFLSQDTTRYMD